ncbi:hypothetical protein Tco_0531256 [Tanacetum coccineum]
MGINEPEYGIFITDEFGDQAFQRWSDIKKVGMEALVSYLVAASMVQSPKNARFSMKLKKVIVEHLDQEKLKSKKCEKKLCLLTHTESVDSTKYRGMIGSLLYLTKSRTDIVFSVCLCARFQEDPKTSHLEAVSVSSDTLKVTDIAQKDKNKAKRTKPSTGIERVREIKAEGKPLTPLTPLKATLAILNILIGGKDVEAIKGYDDGFMNQGLRLVDEDAPEVHVGGILRRLEAFVASPIGCGGSDIGIAE